jgi:hypothetical protein
LVQPVPLGLELRLIPFVFDTTHPKLKKGFRADSIFPRQYT